MPTYVVRGNIYFTQEYGYVYQIEADTPEDASEKFQELITSRNFPSNLEISESGDPAQNQGGTYNVYANEDDSEDELIYGDF
jgi:fibronectin type 3 domain-containing protein